ncbi:pyruvate decarboxylase [Diplodia corticola]|uniref:Pyruvate decarboxylase n=1 Tax=Diplodia corticola TaxID=236234 RepID=A0A1J9QVP3_9PEZI|nr:pyruvate decarboxylase [Diplodia corticola]OJD32066.1 pyruvate decarboxylase [Diplodia corticola]
MSTITLGRYLWERLHQVGVDTILGVPGDFNLQFLDYIYEVEGLRWVGNANELNAAYAADGYGRVKGVPGVVVTTHGVGELSALNGIAGAHSEQVKVIHVVGQTTRKMQQERMLIHHAISNDPDHKVYSKMSKLARVAEAELDDINTAPAEIDRVIRECFLQSRPVYIFLPLDLSQETVPATLLSKPIDLSPPISPPSQSAAASAILAFLRAARHPAIYIDCLTQRHNAVAEARALVRALRLPVFASNMGKCIVDECDPLFVGTLNGALAAPGVADALAARDAVLVLGDLPCDTNTGAFTRPIDLGNAAVVNPFDVRIKGETTFAGTYMKPLLAELAERAAGGGSEPDDGNWPPREMPALPRLEDCPDHPAHPRNCAYQAFPEQTITHEWVWRTIADGFLREGDVVIPDTGTSTFGLADAKFPVRNVRFVAQTYYGSIGWSVPAALGSELALEEMAAAKQRAGAPDARFARGRTLLFVGDGSLGLTVQELGTMVQQGTKPIVFIINNKGYTIERIIHGANYSYNDVNRLSYQHLLPLFQHPSPDTCYRRCASKHELVAALADPELRDPERLQVVEVVMDRLDVPWRLMEIIRSRAGKGEELRGEGFFGQD